MNQSLIDNPMRHSVINGVSAKELQQLRSARRQRYDSQACDMRLEIKPRMRGEYLHRLGAHKSQPLTRAPLPLLGVYRSVVRIAEITEFLLLRAQRYVLQLSAHFGGLIEVEIDLDNAGDAPVNGCGVAKLPATVRRL